jgi:hypothetical protein
MVVFDPVPPVYTADLSLPPAVTTPVPLVTVAESVPLAAAPRLPVLGGGAGAGGKTNA